MCYNKHKLTLTGITIASYYNILYGTTVMRAENKYIIESHNYVLHGNYKNRGGKGCRLPQERK